MVIIQWQYMFSGITYITDFLSILISLILVRSCFLILLGIKNFFILLILLIYWFTNINDAMDIVDLLILVTVLISLGYLNTGYTHMSVNVMTDLLILYY